jgi:hypothetical protein
MAPTISRFLATSRGKLIVLAVRPRKFNSKILKRDLLKCEL